MACHEIGQAFDLMSSDMGGKLSHYFYNLQQRYGDPRVYAQQKEQMQQEEARVIHSKARHTAELLKDAYGKQQESISAGHSERMLKRRSDRNPASPPESSAQPARGRKPRPARPPPDGRDAAGPSDP